MCIANIDGKFEKVNPEWEKTLGYSPEALRGRSFLDFIHPDDLQQTIEAIDKLGSQEQIINFVNRYRCSDGSYKYIEWRSHPFGNSIYASARDVTNRIIDENRIKESENNFRAFFETIDDMIFIADKNGTIIHTNQAVSKKLGYSLDDLKKMHLLDIHPETVRKEAETIFQEMFRGDRSACPLPLVMSNGKSIPVETRVWFGKWNGIDCIFGVSKDLSHEQAALKKFNKLFENNPALMAVSTISDHKYTEVNRAFLQKTGFTRDECIGRTAIDLGLFADDAKERHQLASQILSEQKRLDNFELKVVKKNGEILDGLFSGEVIEDPQGQLLLTVMTDITSQKKSEQLQQLLIEMAQKYINLPLEEIDSAVQ